MNKKILAKLVVCLLAIGITVTASAVTVFSETFDDNAKGWKEDANWQVVDGTYKFTSPIDYFTYKTSFQSVNDLVTTADFQAGAVVTISYDFMFEAPWIGFQMQFAFYDEVGNGISTRATKEYGEANVCKEPDGIAAKLGRQTMTFQNNQWNHCEAVFTANTCKTTFNGVTIYNDPWTITDIDTIGFRIWRANGQFDNLRVDVSYPNPTALSEGHHVFDVKISAKFLGEKGNSTIIDKEKVQGLLVYTGETGAGQFIYMEQGEPVVVETDFVYVEYVNTVKETKKVSITQGVASTHIDIDGLLDAVALGSFRYLENPKGSLLNISLAGAGSAPEDEACGTLQLRYNQKYSDALNRAEDADAALQEIIEKTKGRKAKKPKKK